jgi:hypothetical protein
MVFTFVLAGLAAGFATYLVNLILGAGTPRTLAYTIGLLAGLASGFALVWFAAHRIDVPIPSLVGAIVGPIAARRITRPYRIEP